MTIYEAPFLGKAKPIKTIAPKKKAPAKKNVDQEATATEKPKPKPRAKKPATTVTPPPSDVPDDSNVEVAESAQPEKPKPKPRKRKAPEAVEEAAVKPKKKPAAPKVPKAKPEGEEVKTSKAKGKKVIIDGETAEKPPTWIKQFVGDISKQINSLKPKEEKKPAAEVKEDAEKLVEKKWSDPEFQKKMERKQKAYVSSIYQQIWGNSKLHMQDV